jgi:eukaryotic-like serine/threonine-protein kinase
MAELFLARDPQAAEQRVIKRILPYLSHEADFVQMFLDEARIAAQLHHENVIQLFELGRLHDSIFIAMEFVDGVDLRNLLQAELKRGGTVPIGIAAWIAARVCDGLHYAHNRVGLDGRPMEIIHRDISPQNVMVGYDGRVKLVDFGIARAGAFMERSKPGVIKGKFLYLSPEQLTQNPIDHRADLFALGTMLYEITTGKSPFHKITTEAVILAIRNEDPPPPHLASPQYPTELSRIVMRCLTKDRSRRYQQAGEIAADLTRFLARHAPTTQADVARYVAGVFGDDGERTVMNVPGLEALRKELAAPPPAKPKPPPLPAVPREAEDAVDVTRTEMARPLDLKAILGPQPLSAPSLSSIGDLLDEQSSTLSASGRDLPEASVTSTTAPLRGPRPRVKEPPRAPALLMEPPTRREIVPGGLPRSLRSSDPEDESTTDYGTFARTEWVSLLTPKRIIVAAIGAAVLLIAGAAIVRATRAPAPADVEIAAPGAEP